MDDLQQQLQQLNDKSQTTLNTFGELWRGQTASIAELEQQQQQQQLGLAGLLRLQNHYLKQMASAVAVPEDSLLAHARSPQTQFWLLNPKHRTLIKILRQQLSDDALQDLLSQDVFFSQLNHVDAEKFTQGQWLQLLLNPGLRALFNHPFGYKLFRSNTLSSMIHDTQWVATLGQEPLPTLLQQAKFAELFEQDDFQKLFEDSAFVKLFEDSAFVKLFEDSAFVKLFEDNRFVRRFAYEPFITQFTQGNIYTKIQQAQESSPALIKHWPKLAGSAAPRLAYWNSGDYKEINNQRSALKRKFSLITDTNSASTLQQSLMQGQVNTLVIPVFGNELPKHSLYRDFVALGGRIISNSYDRNIKLINALFGWNLQFKQSYSSGFLTGRQLQFSALYVRVHTNTTKRSSLPSNAQVFLHHSDNSDHIADVYISYGFGEVILLGYEWWSGSDPKWDDLLYSLIEGTALPYQRKYN